jgi:Putative peptidoglycan binding domain
MKFALTFLLILAALAAAPDPQTSPKKSASAKKTTAKRKGKSAARPAARQLTPTPERYKEIQQALAKKGYLKSEPNGVWGADSTEALRQFQTDQKLAPSGKINASSLIALGLGPKTAGPATGSVTPPAEPPKPSSTRPDQ